MRFFLFFFLSSSVFFLHINHLNTSQIMITFSISIVFTNSYTRNAYALHASQCGSYLAEFLFVFVYVVVVFADFSFLFCFYSLPFAYLKT